MSRYLVDSNHLSAYLDSQPVVTPRIDAAIQAGHRVGVCLPVLCEYRAGIRLGRRYQQNLTRLRAAMHVFRFWPTDADTAAEYGRIAQELRAVGRQLAQFDLLIAAIARQHGLILLTADQDFQPVSQLQIENWL